jgi:hypothetical protein
MIGRMFILPAWQKTSVKYKRGNLSENSGVLFVFNYKKESFEVENLEASLFDNAGLLDVEKEDNFKDLKFRYYYLCTNTK